MTGGRASAVFRGDQIGQVATLGFYVEKSKTFKKRNLARRDGSLGELWSGTFYRSIPSAESI
jgi:hypothetical protein